MAHLVLKQVLKHIIMFSALCNTQQVLRDVQAPRSGASVSLFECSQGPEQQLMFVATSDVNSVASVRPAI